MITGGKQNKRERRARENCNGRYKEKARRKEERNGRGKSSEGGSHGKREPEIEGFSRAGKDTHMKSCEAEEAE